MESEHANAVDAAVIVHHKGVGGGGFKSGHDVE